jgi:hypothetical protein
MEIIKMGDPCECYRAARRLFYIEQVAAEFCIQNRYKPSHALVLSFYCILNSSGHDQFSHIESFLEKSG